MDSVVNSVKIFIQNTLEIIKDCIMDCFIDCLFLKGIRRELEESDIRETRRRIRSKYVYKQLKQQWANLTKILCVKTHTILIIWLLLIKSIAVSFVLGGVFLFLEHSLNLMKDLYLADIVTINLEDSNKLNTSLNDSMIKDSGILIKAGLLILAAFGEMLTSNIKSYFDLFSVTYLRTLCESLIYFKLIHVKQHALKDTNIIHLVCNDAQIFHEGISNLHILWVAPFELAAVIFFTWTKLQLGVAVVPGVCFMVMLSALQILLSKKFQIMRRQMLHYADKRLNIIHNLVNKIFTIRLLAWEEPFKNINYKVKAKEDSYLIKLSIIRACKLIFFLTAPTIGTFLTALVYSLINESRITGGQINTCFLMYAQVSSTLILEFNHAIYLLSELQVSIKRIAKLIQLEEYPKTFYSVKHKKNDSFLFDSQSFNKSQEEQISSNTEPYVEMFSTNNNVKLSVKITPYTDSNILGISANIEGDHSRLLLAIIGELNMPPNINFVTYGSTVYVSKDPWLFAGTVKENIIFGVAEDEDRYNKVLRWCCLTEDLRNYPEGDLTQVIDKVDISKSSIAMKICIARAIYRDVDIYLFDNPYYYVDIETATQIFRNVTTFALKNKLIIIATNQQEILSLVNCKILLEHGDITKVETVKEKIFSKAKVRRKQFMIKRNDDVKPIIFAEMPKEEKLDKTSRKIQLFRQRAFSQTLQLSNSPTKSKNEIREIYNVLEDTKLSRISIMTYFKYILYGAKFPFLYSLGVFAILAEMSNILSLVGWFFFEESTNVTNSSSIEQGFILEYKRNSYILVAVCAFLTALFYCLHCISLILILLKSSDVLHDKMFYAMLYAKSTFFMRTPVGIIVNRFTKDIGVCDDILPYHFAFFSVLSVQALGVIGLTFSINLTILVPTVLVLTIILLVFRWTYLRTSRSVRSLESKLCSPLYSHYRATQDGILTIQSHNQQHMLLQYFFQVQEQYTKVFYCHHLIKVWVGIRVGLIGIVLLAILTFIIINIIETNYLVATTLGQVILVLWMLKHWMLLSIDVENEMISVQRLMSYQNLSPETKNKFDNDSPKPDWPNEGKVTFRNVTFSFAPYLPNKLEKVTFSIEPHQTVGIVGKNASAILAVLLCLNEYSGVVEIDGVDICKVNPITLRNILTVIPNVCVVLDETLRFNLDPFSQFSDKEIWDALDIAQLKGLIQSLPNELHFDMKDFEDHFSTGQRKLFSLARAILKKSPILIIDNATNGFDVDTDKTFNNVLRTYYQNTTIIYITDRLNKLIYCDQIMVFEGTKLKEYDKPSNLIKSNSSFYKKMASTYTETQNQEIVSKLIIISKRKSFHKHSKLSIFDEDFNSSNL